MATLNRPRRSHFEHATSSIASLQATLQRAIVAADREAQP
jgi:hypothetical protein